MKSHAGADLRAREVSPLVKRILRASGARSGVATAAIGFGVSGWLGGAQPAWAAEANEAASDDALQEVVVTVQFRSQSVQTAPSCHRSSPSASQQLDERLGRCSVNDPQCRQRRMGSNSGRNDFTWARSADLHPWHRPERRPPGTGARGRSLCR